MPALKIIDNVRFYEELSVILLLWFFLSAMAGSIVKFITVSSYVSFPGTGVPADIPYSQANAWVNHNLTELEQAM